MHKNSTSRFIIKVPGIQFTFKNVTEVLLHLDKKHISHTLLLTLEQEEN